MWGIRDVKVERGCGGSCRQTARPALDSELCLSRRAAGTAALRHTADTGSWVGDARATTPAGTLLGLWKFGLPRTFGDELE